MSFCSNGRQISNLRAHRLYSVARIKTHTAVNLRYPGSERSINSPNSPESPRLRCPGYYAWVSEIISFILSDVEKFAKFNGTIILPFKLFYYCIIYFFICSQNVHTNVYCHVQREQDNKAQITGTNSCPLSLNHTATDTNTVQCI